MARVNDFQKTLAKSISPRKGTTKAERGEDDNLVYFGADVIRK